MWRWFCECNNVGACFEEVWIPEEEADRIVEEDLLLIAGTCKVGPSLYDIWVEDGEGYKLYRQES